jgi:hypothetical protein
MFVMVKGYTQLAPATFLVREHSSKFMESKSMEDHLALGKGESPG